MAKNKFLIQAFGFEIATNVIKYDEHENQIKSTSVNGARSSEYL